MIDYLDDLDNIDKQLKTQSNSYARARYSETRRQNYVVNRLNRLRARSLTHGWDFNLEPQDIVIPETCPVLGIKLALNTKPQDDSPSIDRIDNSKGYIKGNVHVISFKANRIKNNATPEELMKVASYFLLQK